MEQFLITSNEKEKEQNPFHSHQFKDPMFLEYSVERRYQETIRSYVNYLPLIDGFPLTGRYDQFMMVSPRQWMKETIDSNSDDGRAEASYLYYHPNLELIETQYQIIEDALANNYEATLEQNNIIKEALQVLYKIAYPNMEDHSIIISRAQALQILNTCEQWDALPRYVYSKYHKMCEHLGDENYRDLKSRGVVNASELANWRTLITSAMVLWGCGNKIFQAMGYDKLVSIENDIKYYSNLTDDEKAPFLKKIDKLLSPNE